MPLRGGPLQPHMRRSSLLSGGYRVPVGLKATLANFDQSVFGRWSDPSTPRGHARIRRWIIAGAVLVAVPITIAKILSGDNPLFAALTAAAVISAIVLPWEWSSSRRIRRQDADRS